MRKKTIIGQSKMMHCGMKCTVIKDNGYDDIAVQFEDGTIKKCTRQGFNKGSILNPSLKRKISIKGKSNTMSNGMKCTVIEDNGYDNISVQFEDGTIKNNCTRYNFFSGKITNPSLRRGYTCSRKYSIQGKSKVMSNGMKCTIIEDNGRDDIIVKFEDGYITKSSRYNFNKGKIANPNFIKGSVLGQSALMRCGMRCTVVEDKSSRDITVKFEDGTLVKHIRRDYFKNKSIANPKLGKNFSRVINNSIKGNSKIMKSGLRCTVIEDMGKNKITVQFEDGKIKKNCSRDSYFKGSIIHPDLGRGYAYSKKNSILGQTKLMKCGMRCTVIEDNSADDISVQFEDGTIVRHRIRHSFQSRSILNPSLMNVSSMPQRLIFYFLHEFYPDTVQNYRPDWLKNKETNANMELDLWIPSKKIGIEYDGVVWHKEENYRSKKKFELIRNAQEIDKVITILEKGAFEHKSSKHINIKLTTTSDKKETDLFFIEMEKAITQILKYLKISKEIKIDDDVIEKVCMLKIARVYSQNLIRGENDLETLCPNLAKEWDYNKNNFLPSDITCGSGRRVWWICNKCGHSWSTLIQDRAKNGRGCPKCARENRGIKVKNMDTGEIFKSLSAASRFYHTTNENISKCCKNEKETAGGYHWEFIKNE